MRSTFQKSPTCLNGSTVGRPFQFALLLLALSFGWNAIIPQALAANSETVSINASVANVAESGLVPGVLTFTRTDSLGVPVFSILPLTVNYTISGTAANGTDYSSIGTSVI